MKPAAKTLIFEQRVILWLSLPLAALVILCSAVGLLYPEIYTMKSANWVTQTVVQDGVDLFVVAPALLVAGLYSYQGIKAAIVMWGGVVGYLAYTFFIYCFAVAFNMLFLAYCFILGLSVFSIAWFFFIQIRNAIVTSLSSVHFARVTGLYFVIIALAFYFLWLADVIPASISQTTPQSLTEIGLLTNPVHVLDLSIMLPLILICGVMTFKSKPFAATLVPVLLVFFILMDITICALTVVMVREGFGGSMEVVIAMGILAIFSMALLIWFIEMEKDELSN